MPRLQHGVASALLSPYVLSNTLSLSKVNAVSAFYTIQIGRTYCVAAVQHERVIDVRYTECYSLQQCRWPNSGFCVIGRVDNFVFSIYFFAFSVYSRKVSLQRN